MSQRAPSDHVLTFRVPAGYAICLVCLQLLTAAELGTACPGLAVELGTPTTEEGNRP